MANGGCDIEDDDCLRDSVAKTLLEIGELKSELENKLKERESERHCAWLSAAEAAKKEEVRVKAEEIERINREEKRKAQQKAMVLDEEEERKKWEQVLATQREISEKEKSKREREQNAKKEEDKQARLRKHQEQKLQQRQEQNNIVAERHRKEREREIEREAQKRLEQERIEKFDKEPREREERVAKERENIGKVLKQEEAAKKVREREDREELELEKRKLELERQRRQREREARDRLEQAAKARKKKAEEETRKKKAQEFRPLYQLQLQNSIYNSCSGSSSTKTPSRDGRDNEAISTTSARSEDHDLDESGISRHEASTGSSPRISRKSPQVQVKVDTDSLTPASPAPAATAGSPRTPGSASSKTPTSERRRTPMYSQPYRPPGRRSEEKRQEETFATRCALCAPQAHGMLAISSSEVHFRNFVARRAKEDNSSSPDSADSELMAQNWQGADLHDGDLSDAAPVQDTSSCPLTPVDWFQLSNSYRTAFWAYFTPETRSEGTNVSTAVLNTMAEEQQNIRRSREKMYEEASSAHAQVLKDEKQETERLFMSKFFGDEECDTYGSTSLRYDVGASEFKVNNFVGPYGADGLLEKTRVQLDEAGVLTGRKQALDELDVKYRCVKTASEAASKAVSTEVRKANSPHIIKVWWSGLSSDGVGAMLMPSLQAPKKTWTPNAGASEFKVKTAN